MTPSAALQPAPSATAVQTDLVVVVPGLDAVRRGEALERLLDGLERYFGDAGRGFPAYRLATRQGEGVAQAVVEFETTTGTKRSLEIRELEWNDLRPSMKDVSPYARLGRGIQLSAYWFGPLLTRRMPKTSAALRNWLLFGIVSLMLWYGLVATAAIRLFWPSIQDFLWGTRPVAPEGSGWLAWGWDKLSDPKLLWAFVIAALGFKPLVDNTDSSWTIYAFMQDRDSFRRKLRLRLRGLLAHVAASGSAYGRIVVLAHSFGAAVTADALGAEGRDGIPIPPLDLVTLGSPLEFLAFRDPEIKAITDRCLRTDAVRSWLDFHAPEDAFCSPVPLEDGAAGKFRSRPVDLGQSPVASALGQAHNLYFGHAEILDVIVGEPGRDRA
jgi:hypothetical protein